MAAATPPTSPDTLSDTLPETHPAGPIRLAVANHKGGVGKTTTTANLASYWAQTGGRVLTIDLDPQANLTRSFGLSLERTPDSYELLRGDAPLTEVLERLSPTLTLLPTTPRLARAELDLAAEPGGELVLREHLQPVLPHLDYVLIDCPPSLGLLTLNALALAQYLLVPMQPEFLALDGLQRLLDRMAVVKERINPELQLIGIFCTQFDKRKVLHRDVRESLQKRYPAQVLETVVRPNVALAEAPGTGQSIFRYAPESHGSKDYQSLAKELTARLG